MKTVIYPGSFDPITYGHLDVIDRALTLFDKVIVSIGDNSRKEPLFSLTDRLDMIGSVTADMNNIEIDHFSGLLVDHAQSKGACAIIRGLRAISDFEFEFQLALMNRHIEPDISTVFLMPHFKYTHLNSTIIREVARLGGDMSDFAPPVVIDALKRVYSQ